MSYRYALENEVLKLSSSKKWSSAVLEWEISDWDKTEYEESCVCGKEGIKHIYTIRNTITGEELFPIGSQCIKKFEREDLTDKMAVLDKMFALQQAYESDYYITLTSEYFSRKSLLYMYENGAFKDTNYGSAEDTYDFLLKMFNMRSEPSSKQMKKIKAHIMADIRPYCKWVILERETM